jgi:hypothetical protein
MSLFEKMTLRPDFIGAVSLSVLRGNDLLRQRRISQLAGISTPKGGVFRYGNKF